MTLQVLGTSDEAILVEKRKGDDVLRLEGVKKRKFELLSLLISRREEKKENLKIYPKTHFEAKENRDRTPCPTIDDVSRVLCPK